MGRWNGGDGTNPHLPITAYGYAEANPLYQQVWAVETRADVGAIVTELPPLVAVRAGYLAARSVEPILDAEHPGDRRLPIAIAAIERWLNAQLSNNDLVRFRAPAQDSANTWTMHGSSSYVRSTFAVIHALAGALAVTRGRCPSNDATLALHYAANAVGYDCSEIRGVLAPVVRQHLAREWTANMLRVARNQGVRLYGNMQDRAVAVDVALDADGPA